MSAPSATNAWRCSPRLTRRTLPLELRESYESALRNWAALRELTEGDAHEFHLALSEELGREMTAAELRALLGLTPPH